MGDIIIFVERSNIQAKKKKTKPNQKLPQTSELSKVTTYNINI